MTKELSVPVALGYSVAGKKQERKLEALAKIEAEKNAITLSADIEKTMSRKRNERRFAFSVTFSRILLAAHIFSGVISIWRVSDVFSKSFSAFHLIVTENGLNALVKTLYGYERLTD